MTRPRFISPPSIAPSPYTPGVGGGSFDQGRRQALAQISSLESSNVRVRGTITLAGVGEVSQTVSFPVQFTDKPTILFTYERTYAPAGATLPTFSAVVLGYSYETDVNNDPTVWTGATFALVLGGDDAQTGELTYVVDGPIVLNSGL